MRYWRRGRDPLASNASANSHRACVAIGLLLIIEKARALPERPAPGQEEKARTDAKLHLHSRDVRV